MFKAHRRLYHSTLGLRVIKKKKKEQGWGLTMPHTRMAAWYKPVRVTAMSRSYELFEWSVTEKA